MEYHFCFCNYKNRPHSAPKYHNCQCYWNEKWDSFFKFLISGGPAELFNVWQSNLVFDRTVRQSQPEPIHQSIPANTLSNLPAIHHQYCKDFPASLNEWTLLSQPTYWDSPPNIDSTNRDFTLNKVFLLGHLLLDNAIPCCSSEIFKCHCKASNRVMSTSTISFCSKNCVLCEELLYINHRIVKKSNHTQSVWHNEHCTLLDQLSGIYFLYTQGFMSWCLEFNS